MKKWILILLLASLTINCSYDDEVNINQQLIGEWKWIESSGGIQGEILNPQTTGENRNIEITSDKIKYYTNGILTSEFDYYLQKGESIRTNEKTDLMIYENDRKQSIVLNGNKLILYDECYDCYQNEYIKD
ncbi:MAG: hypothetical protein A3F91_10230 [Flavobacteria bacterium RIFCSPLOWO2_12_FULL_35_11]|nr:MAG: hypothetical protein A3F91_10230 [Flavobacteria bacterium RIFCSPLOWO2_12_FULL_35_11]